MEKPILLVDFGRLMGDQLRNGLNINKKTFILDEYVVDAIPVEWIERKLAEHWYVDYDIRELLEDWEKEERG